MLELKPHKTTTGLDKTIRRPTKGFQLKFKPQAIELNDCIHEVLFCQCAVQTLLETDLLTFARTPELHLSPEQLAHLFQGSPQDTAARSNPDLVRMILSL